VRAALCGAERGESDPECEEGAATETQSPPDATPQQNTPTLLYQLPYQSTLLPKLSRAGPYQSDLLGCTTSNRARGAFDMYPVFRRAPRDQLRGLSSDSPFSLTQSSDCPNSLSLSVGAGPPLPYRTIISPRAHLLQRLCTSPQLLLKHTTQRTPCSPRILPQQTSSMSAMKKTKFDVETKVRTPCPGPSFPNPAARPAPDGLRAMAA